MIDREEVERFAAELRRWWRFDNQQSPASSWHDREDFIECALPRLLTEDRARRDKPIAPDPQDYETREDFEKAERAASVKEDRARRAGECHAARCRCYACFPTQEMICAGHVGATSLQRFFCNPFDDPRCLALRSEMKESADAAD